MFKNFSTKNISKYSWFSFLPTLILFPITLYLFITGIIPPVYLFATIIGWVLIVGLGVATGLHRIFAHKTHDLPLWKENIVLFLAILGGQGSSITWVAIHRGYHHRFTDTPQDLHSPVNGAYNAFFGWTTKITENSKTLNLRSAVDLLRKPNHLWFHKHQLTVQWLVPIIIALFNWKLAIALIILPRCISIIGDNLVNITGHRKMITGYKVGDSKDNSYNNILLSFLCFGQAWHNGHHLKPNMFMHGKAVSGNWWEFDLCIIFLPFLGKPRVEAQ